MLPGGAVPVATPSKGVVHRVRSSVLQGHLAPPSSCRERPQPQVPRGAGALCPLFCFSFAHFPTVSGAELSGERGSGMKYNKRSDKRFEATEKKKKKKTTGMQNFVTPLRCCCFSSVEWPSCPVLSLDFPQTTIPTKKKLQQEERVLTNTVQKEKSACACL